MRAASASIRVVARSRSASSASAPDRVSSAYPRIVVRGVRSS